MRPSDWLSHGLKRMSSRSEGSVLPRYFLVQKDDDLIVLDIRSDRYYWRAGTRVEAIVASDVPGDHTFVELRLQSPNGNGHRPRGVGRYWAFEPIVVAQAIFYLAKAHAMTLRGFPAFVDSLNSFLLSAPIAPAQRTLSLVRLAAAMEWARLLFPRRAKCLSISIATAMLARRHGIPANVVVGVQALPLQAHAWAQVGDSLINDMLDRVSMFRPILSLPYTGAAHQAGRGWA